MGVFSRTSVCRIARLARMGMLAVGAWTFGLLMLPATPRTVRAAEPPDGFPRETWNSFQFQLEQFSELVDGLSFDQATREPPEDSYADAKIFLKGIRWALEYDHSFTDKDVATLTRAVARGKQRADALSKPKTRGAWTSKRGRVLRGFVSKIDGSTQPYGMIVPESYDGVKPMRLDIVLHGSTKPVGLSELKFIERFDSGDTLTDAETPPAVDYLELHPLGRVENGYRWAGESDVFEAIEAACREYRVDPDRIVLRGMSMGASGTWHLGLKHPDRFVALGPYCGYVDTHRFSETPLPSFVKVGELPAVQEKMLHMLDSVDYAANAGVVPAVACMGEKDVFFQAHEIMREAMTKEGLNMVNLISPGTGHVVDPKTHAEQLRQIAEHVRPGLNRSPKSLRFVTWTLKYHRCHWLRLLELERHYERAEFNARLDDAGVLQIDEPRNIVRFAVDPPMLTGARPRVAIAGRELVFPRGSVDGAVRPYVFTKRGGEWSVAREPDEKPEQTAEASAGKRPGLQGPIDDAFTRPFVCVRGTGRPWNVTAQAAADASLRRFTYEWRRYFRGELLIVDDHAVSDETPQHVNLILFGDPGSNRWIRAALPKLPIEWTIESLKVAGRTYSSADHLPALIVPNPLPGAQGRYLVLNCGHTFHEPELSSLNYLLYPRLGDWAVFKVGLPREYAKTPSAAVVEEVKDFGLADEQWRIVR